MKRISIFLAMTLLATPAMVRAQDAATEERLNKLAAQLDVLTEAKNAQDKKIDELIRAVEALQTQASKPSPNYASAEDVKHLADKIKEVDQKRIEDNERILDSVKAEVKKIGATISKASTSKPSTPVNDTPIPDKGYEYIIQPGDSLSAIVAAYREKNIKVTVNQILKANPGLDATKLKVNQKIFIPAPQ
ncbi:MAG TPA: LysM peptidoglycan-binding domain-containing protein [Candidatus Paceibacterota bacterium]|nr:LysM peptidoglycan-binding domain-containing protein [Candidatus Paceibacterota bacterium]